MSADSMTEAERRMFGLAVDPVDTSKLPPTSMGGHDPLRAAPRGTTNSRSAARRLGRMTADVDVDAFMRQGEAKAREGLEAKRRQDSSLRERVFGTTTTNDDHKENSGG